MNGKRKGMTMEEELIADLTAINFREINATPNPENPTEFLRIKKKTSARLGVWRTGPRYRTETYLRFRADHAAAMDAVFRDVSEILLEENELFSIQTKCTSKNEFLTRPDLGQQFSRDELQKLKNGCIANPDIQFYFADGLSSTSVERNLPDLLPALEQGLENSGLIIGTPFFVKYGRVRSMDVIAETLGAKVTVVFLGERPGLATSESMSAYICYEAYVGVPEARRTVVSNIHQEGTNPVEAGAFIAELLERMYHEKSSGLDFKI